MNQTTLILALVVAGLGVYMLTRPDTPGVPVAGTPPVSQASDFEDAAGTALLSWVFGPHGSTTA